MANTVPVLYAVVTMSTPYAKSWFFCIDRCADVIHQWLDHSWTPGDDVPVVPIDANGRLTEGDASELPG